jgi:hypothetical protein
MSLAPLLIYCLSPLSLLTYNKITLKLELLIVELSLDLCKLRVQQLVLMSQLDCLLLHTIRASLCILIKRRSKAEFMSEELIFQGI